MGGGVSEGLCHVCLEQLLWFLCAFLPTVNTIVFARNHYGDNVNARQFSSNCVLVVSVPTRCTIVVLIFHSLQHSCPRLPLMTAELCHCLYSLQRTCFIFPYLQRTYATLQLFGMSCPVFRCLHAYHCNVTLHYSCIFFKNFSSLIYFHFVPRHTCAWLSC